MARPATRRTAALVEREARAARRPRCPLAEMARTASLGPAEPRARAVTRLVASSSLGATPPRPALPERSANLAVAAVVAAAVAVSTQRAPPLVPCTAAPPRAPTPPQVR